MLTHKDKQPLAGEFPQRIEIELSARCNLHCTYCPRKHLLNLGGFIDLGLFKRIIDQAGRYPQTILVLHRRGESLLHPDFLKICDYLKGKFSQVQLATNATILDEERSRAIINAISFLSFSIDIPEAFNRTRLPAQYCQVEENILRFLELNKNKVKTQVSMVKTQETPAENTELFKKIWQGKVDRIRIYEEHSRDGKFGSLCRKRDKRMPCVMPFYEMLIFCDGKVGRCNHDWNGTPLADTNISLIKEIWRSKVYAGLRQQHLELKIQDKVCQHCDSWYPEIGRQETGQTIEDA